MWCLEGVSCRVSGGLGSSERMEAAADARAAVLCQICGMPQGRAPLTPRQVRLAEEWLGELGLCPECGGAILTKEQARLVAQELPAGEASSAPPR